MGSHQIQVTSTFRYTSGLPVSSAPFRRPAERFAPLAETNMEDSRLQLLTRDQIALETWWVPLPDSDGDKEVVSTQVTSRKRGEVCRITTRFHIAHGGVFRLSHGEFKPGFRIPTLHHVPSEDNSGINWVSQRKRYDVAHSCRTR